MYSGPAGRHNKLKDQNLGDAHQKYSLPVK